MGIFWIGLNWADLGCWQKETRNKSPEGSIPQCHHKNNKIIKYRNQYPKIWIVPKEVNFTKKTISQNPGIYPKKYPKIQEHP